MLTDDNECENQMKIGIYGIDTSSSEVGVYFSLAQFDIDDFIEVFEDEQEALIFMETHRP
jgi:hypothetical protein